MKAADEPRVNLRVYALKLRGRFAEVATREVALDIDEDEPLKRVTLKVEHDEAPFEAALFVPSRESRFPHWLSFLEQGFHDVVGYFSENTANSALLVVKAGSRYFALPFGYGRSLINREHVVAGFGVRTALGLIEQGSIASVDSKEVDYTTFYKNIQSTRRVPIHEFAIDVEKDMLRGVYGFPARATDLCTKVLGSEALYINPRTGFEGLGKVLVHCQRVYDAKGYKKDFDWIDNVRPVANPTLIARLDKKLVNAVRTDDPTVTMGAPEPIQRTNTLGFSFSRGRREEIVDDVTLDEYRARFRHIGRVELKQLKTDRIRLLGLDTGAVLEKWPAYRWLMFETTHYRREYVLQDGAYYEVARDFRRRLDRWMRDIRRTRIRMPVWDQAVHSTEADYNRAVAGTLRGAVLMDRLCATDFAGRSRIEVCDVVKFTGAKASFIHVKKYDGSGVLSHLFSQGAVSAEALLEDVRFRSEVRALLPSRHRARIPRDGASPADIEVVFAMAFKSPGRQALATLLPFFSKLNLRQRARALRRMGVDCTVSVVEYRPAP